MCLAARSSRFPSEPMTAPVEAFQPKFTTLVELLLSAAREHADLPLFGTRRGEAIHFTTYRKVQDLVEAFRGGLASLGVARGDRVAVVSTNRLEWAVGAHASYGLGAAYVPM